MRTKSNVRVGISIGDMNGIGPEVILKSLQDPRVLELFTPVIFANSKMMSFLVINLILSYNLMAFPMLVKLLKER